MESKKYAFIKHRAKTLDIFLFSGEGNFSSLIQCCTQTQYSHIGIVISELDLRRIGILVPMKYKDPDGLYLFHSNKGSIEGIVDIYTKDEKSGAQINSLSEVVNLYKGTIYYRSLDTSTTGLDFKKLKKSFIALLPQQYETNYCQMLCAVFPCITLSKDTSELFCSELVAQVLIDQGALPLKMASDNYIPSDFSEDFEDVKLKKGWKFGKQYHVKV
jgi:hypothetical protein